MKKIKFKESYFNSEKFTHDFLRLFQASESLKDQEQSLQIAAVKKIKKKEERF